MIFLNRLRGTNSIWSKIIGLFLIGLFSIFINIWAAVAVGVLYVLGESMGWGKWIGGIMHQNTGPATPEELADLEGRDNGIHFIANTIISETKNYYDYCIIALSLRGFYWFGLMFLPLVIGGFLSFPLYLVFSILLGIAFPISIELGRWSKDKFTIDTKYFKVMGHWEHSEIWYGLFQDIVLITILLLI